MPEHGRCNHGPGGHEALIGKVDGAWRTAAKRQYPPELGRILAQALLHSLPTPAVDGDAREGEAEEAVAMQQFEVALGGGIGPTGSSEWRDLDSAGLQAARRAGDARAARKTAALARIRLADHFVDSVLHHAGGEAVV